MYAVIETGGKQHRVTEGQRLDIERVPSPPAPEADQSPPAPEADQSPPADESHELVFEPRLLVDEGRVLAGATVAGARVEARVVGEAKGPKIRGFTYRPKARTRRRWGHRQGYTTIEITSITPGSS